jgi:hypothetical protein
MFWGQANIRLKRLLVISVVVVLCSICFFLFHISVIKASVDSYEDLMEAPTKPFVFIIESGCRHDEVTAAFAFAFSRQTSVVVRLYTACSRFGSPALYDSFFSSGKCPCWWRSSLSAAYLQNGSTPVPDLIVLITCDMDLYNWRNFLDHLLITSTTRILCVNHDSKHIIELADVIDPWAKLSRISLVALSPHVAHDLRTTIGSLWNSSTTTPPPEVTTFVPVFPFAPPSLLDPQQMPEQETIVVQGNFYSEARNYSRLLIAFARLRNERTSSTIAMHLIGAYHDPPQIPSEIDGQVIVEVSLNYTEYYSVMARSFALLPAFATDRYYLSRASSTVAASLITGCPLVASPRLLEAYSYLDESDVWLSRAGEEEMDVVLRVLSESDEAQRHTKREAVRRKRRAVMERNSQWIGEWVHRAIQSHALAQS